MMKNRRWIFGGVAVVLAAAAGYGASTLDSEGASGAVAVLTPDAIAGEDLPLVTLYKNPTCTCCADWAEHMRANGFPVEVREGGDIAAVKMEYGVPFSVASCHTATVDGYALEGHVPADIVKRLLEERPDVPGLAVPGMPLGVPGMPGEGLNSYDVLSFRSHGATQVFASK